MTKNNWFLICLCLVIIIGGLTYRHLVRDTDSRGTTKLMRAIEQQESLKSTTKLIARVQDVNVRDKKGQSALFYAAKYSQDPELIRNLLLAGADILAVDKNGDTPLLVAARENPAVEVIRALVQAGGNVHQPDAQGNTPLALAARYNVGPVIEALLRTDASLDVTDKDGNRVEDKISENMKLSEQEKINYRQIIFIVSVLEARAEARFAAENPFLDEIPYDEPEVEEPNTPLEEEVAAQTELIETEQSENN